jgi:hypothetical protein
MGATIKGTPIPYGTKEGGGIIKIKAMRGTDVIFNGSMYASEVRVSYDSDSNSAVDSNGETISYCIYNRRRTLSLTGIVINTAGGTPDGTAGTLAKAHETFGTAIMPGDDFFVSYGASQEWDEVHAENAAGNIENGAHSGGTGNYVITSVEKTRSNTAFAEWSLTAIEHITADVSTGDTTDD